MIVNAIVISFSSLPCPCSVQGHGPGHGPCPGPSPGPKPKLVPVLGPRPILFLVPALVPVPVTSYFWSQTLILVPVKIAGPIKQWWKILPLFIRAAAGLKASTRQSGQIAVFDMVKKNKMFMGVNTWITWLLVKHYEQAHHYTAMQWHFGKGLSYRDPQLYLLSGTGAGTCTGEQGDGTCNRARWCRGPSLRFLRAYDILPQLPVETA